MTGDDTARLIYLMLLAVAIAGWFFVQNRHSVGKLAQQAAVWGLIFLGAIAVAGLWDDIRGSLSSNQAVISDRVIEVPRGFDGHYHLTLTVNGIDVDFVVDTGASQVVLTREDAERVGLDPDALDFIGSAATANGIVAIAPVRLDEVELGPIRDRNLRAVVNDGDLFSSLLGMDYLGRFSAIEIRDNRLILTR